MRINGPGQITDESAVGDDYELSFAFPVDLTGFTSWAGKARPKGGASDGSDDQTFVVDDSRQDEGVITYTLPSAATTALGETDVQFDFRVVKPNGNRVTWLSGWVSIGQPITEVP